MSKVLTYTRHKFDHGVVQISAEQIRGKHYLRLALKRLNVTSTELVDVVALMFEKKHPQAASAIVDKIQHADFERAYNRLLEEYKLINK